MERSLHRQLKERYGVEIGGRSEVVLGQFRVDAETPDGHLIEIQSGPLGLLKRKLACLLPDHVVNVVKPMVVTRRLIRRDCSDGADLSSRRSPKQGSLNEVFEELVGLARLFPHPHLQIDIVGVEIDEIRVKRRRSPGYLVVDRVLREVVQTIPLRQGRDLWTLLPGPLPDRFTTEDLASSLGRSIPFAQRVAYCLLHSGATEVVAKVGNRKVFTRSDRSISESVGPLVLSHR